MYLTQRGAEYARTVEKKYLPYIDKEKYVFEVSRQELQLRSSGKAAVYKNYMQKVEGETE